MDQLSPFFESHLVFPPEHYHNHASCLVELPDGDLLLCWYHGSGERKADDVIVEGSRRKAGATRWSERFLLADTPNYPDCNPCMFLTRSGRLFLAYVTVLAHEWHTSVLKYRCSSSYGVVGAPIWEYADVIHVDPGESFARELAAAGWKETEHRIAASDTDESARTSREIRRRAQDTLYRLFGWMPRAHPLVLTSGRVVLPLYSDGFDLSLMALSDDEGLNWRASRPLVSLGGVQPSVVEKEDGSLVAYLRDNGRSPGWVMRSTSQDGGESWGEVTDTGIPNPGSGLEAVRLSSGSWIMVCNDTERGRNRLAVMLSEDQGASWKHARYLENDPPGPEAGSYSYPSVIESRDGSIHVSYSYHTAKDGGAIAWAHFNEAWLRAGLPL